MTAPGVDEAPALASAAPAASAAERPPRTAERVTAAATVLMVLVTGVYAFFAYHQWQSTHDAVTAAREATEVANRAWIMPLPLPELSADDITPTTMLLVELRFSNPGHAPAGDLTHAAAMFVGDWPPDPERDFGPLGGMDIASRSDFGPGRESTMLVPLSRLLTAEEVAAVKAGKTQRLYLYARWEYMNGFGHAGVSTLCAYWKAGKFMTCPGYNIMK